jgi:hypothetical protein
MLGAALGAAFIPKSFDADATTATFTGDPRTLGAIAVIFIPNAPGVCHRCELMQTATYSMSRGGSGWKALTAFTSLGRMIPFNVVPGCRNSARAILEDPWVYENTLMIVPGLDGFRQDRHRVLVAGLQHSYANMA